MLALLAERYQERRVALAVTAAGGLVEVLASARGATWTMIVTRPDGTSCVVAGGEGWRTVTPEEPKT